MVKQNLWVLGADICSSKSCFLNDFDAISTNVDFLSMFFFTGKNLQERKMNQAQSVKVYTKWMTTIRNKNVLKITMMVSIPLQLQTRAGGIVGVTGVTVDC